MHTINPKDLKKELTSYNLALLFNRRRAQEIRSQAAKCIHKFANQELWLEAKDCELMYTYIKAFGYIEHRKVTKDAFKSFDYLSRIASHKRPKLFWRLKATPYNIASFWARSVSRMFGRYDRIIYKAPVVMEKELNKPELETKAIKKEEKGPQKIKKNCTKNFG